MYHLVGCFFVPPQLHLLQLLVHLSEPGLYVILNCFDFLGLSLRSRICAVNARVINLLHLKHGRTDVNSVDKAHLETEGVL